MERWKLEGGGTLSLEYDGSRLHVAAECPRDNRGLYKLWLLGPGGRYLAGTMAPEGECLTLRKAINRMELERACCWPVTGGKAVLAFSFSAVEWKLEPHPENMVRDPVLREQLGGPVLCRGDGSGWLLALPFRTDRAVPLVSLFCFARVERVEGRPHLVWRFDGNGWPSALHKNHGGSRE